MKAKTAIVHLVCVCSLVMFTLLCFMVESADCAEKVLALSKNYAWRMISPMPAGHTINRPYVDFIEAMTQRTGGKVKITLYEGTLGAPNDHWDMLKSNAAQFAHLAEGYCVGRMPIGTLSCLAFEASDQVTLMRAFDGWLKAGHLKELTDNFKVLSYKPTPFQHLFFRNKKVTSLEELKGLKIRALSGLHNQAITALGATGVSMPGGELYMAMQTGIIDGMVTGIDNVIDRKFYEPAKYALYLPIYSGMWFFAMNKEVWASLPKDLQDLITEVSSEIAAADFKKRVAEEGSMWDSVKGKIEVYTISPQEQARWKKAVAPVADKYVQDWGAKGFPAKQALDLMRKEAAAK